ncbi:MAG: WYL domain-containing protein [Clostridia bacterium]|nr:WYL domain-containing protein [Clostridia bacterium]
MNSRILLILKYLWEQSDESHTVSIADLSKYLSENGISADRKTIGKNIDALIAFGVDIVKIRRTQNQYFLATRHFEAPEVKMLIDAVQSAKFITPKKSKELIEKLSAFVAPDQTSVLKRHLYVDSRNKAQNETIYIVADSVQTAITENKKITFQYFDYNVNGDQIPRHDGEYYIVSPYDLIWSNDIYYLAGLHEKKGIVAKFRVDRIKNLEISDEIAIEKPSDYSVAEFFSQEFSMFDGEDCKVTLLCENALMNSMVDRFGTDISPEIVDEGHFKITVDVDLSSLFYGWVFASAGRMKIISPKKAVEGFSAVIQRFIK